ncbi:Ger(x)C family spore germination protein [Bacillus sp. FJAT-45350]|uniref:Ger(x)C family spore germination protein n=1 Tax=Bacillus sp. FJAT-45350 TaxID=2011014 RepID=UPI000BB6C9CB|nr:Ger(x)C family spore germination protein [Bacillus sp. FJAT-45350]
MKKVIILVIALLLSGCWDRAELEELAYVIAVGIDMGDHDELIVTYQLARPGATAEGGNEDEFSDIVSVAAPDLLSARDLAVAFVTRDIIFTHSKALIISEEVARANKMMPYLSATVRDRQLRRRMNVIISKEKAEHFLQENKPTLEIQPHRYYDELAERWEDTGFIPDSTLHQLLSRTEENAGLFLASYGSVDNSTNKKEGEEDKYFPGEIKKSGGNPTQTIGSAVIKQGEMIGALNGEETRFSLLLRPKIEVKQMIITFSDPIESEKHITARLLNEQRTEVKVDVKGDKPVVNVMLPVQLDIIGIPSHINYVEDMEKQQILKEHIEAEIKEKTLNLIKKTQEEFRGEPFLWSSIVKRNFLTLQEYESFDWMASYPKAKINVEVDVELKQFGKHLNQMDIRKFKD